MKKSIHNALLLAALLVSSLTYATQDNTIAANHPSLQYTGRIDFSQPLAPKLSWPGTYIRANFFGNSLSLILDDQFGDNYFNVFIDNDFNNPIIIDCIKGKHQYQISDNLPDGEHRLLITKRTEGGEGNTVFNGLILASWGKMLPPPIRPSRRIEFIGDSITSGMGNEAPIDGKDNILAQKNNFQTYGAITARNLNAEYVITSQSGIGIMASWFDFTMPDYFLQLDAKEINQSRWDFDQWLPDVVVINLFQNDSWLVDTRLSPVPSDEQRINAYTDFLLRVKKVYPDTYIIATLGSMSASAPDSKWPTYIKKAVMQFKNKTGVKNIAYMFFDYTGFEKHPRVSHHQQNATKLTAFIKDKLYW